MHPASSPLSAQSSVPGRFPSGPPGGTHRPPAPKIDWGRLFREGWKLIFLSPALVSLYILLFLLNGFAGIYAATYLGKITGGLQIYSRTSESSQPNDLLKEDASATDGQAQKSTPPHRRSSSLIMQSGLFSHSLSSPS